MFEKYTKECKTSVYRLLILDGHGSHITAEFDLFCKEHYIITLCMAICRGLLAGRLGVVTGCLMPGAV